MTREERHIAVLNRMLESMDVYDSILSTTERKKAIKAAIQALSQEPTDTWSIKEIADTFKKHGLIREQEPCTDAVSREAVIYYIKGHIHEIITESGTDKNAHTNSILRALINGVETMPSVTQKSGKWIDYSDESYVEEAIEKLELMRQKVDEETYRALILAIKVLEQKPKTGHWIYDETIENWRCSKCNETPKIMGYCGTANFMAEHFRFCNHCGAKMESDEKKRDTDDSTEEH